MIDYYVPGRKLIIVEGMDSVGKDTQIKAIQNSYQLIIFHTFHLNNVKSRTEIESRRLLEQTYNQLFEIIHDSPSFNYILNRSHYGEYVYGSIYRNYTDPDYIFDLERQEKFIRLLYSAKLIILVNSDFEELIDREDGDSLSQDSERLMQRELFRFNTIYERSVAKDKILIDCNGLSKNEVSIKIFDFLDGCCYDTTDNDSGVST